MSKNSIITRGECLVVTGALLGLTIAAVAFAAGAWLVFGAVMNYLALDDRDMYLLKWAEGILASAVVLGALLAVASFVAGSYCEKRNWCTADLLAGLEAGDFTLFSGRPTLEGGAPEYQVVDDVTNAM